MRAVVFAVVLAGCGSEDPGPADAVERACETVCAPYRCDLVLGQCLTTCAGTGDCLGSHVCDRGFCVGTECTEETAAELCGGYACVQGSCSHDCSSASCTAGYYCRGDTNECVLRCTTREDPLCAGYLCDLETGECESYCFDGELACASGHACNAQNECVAQP